MNHIIIGSKPYINLNLNNLLDNNFDKFYRINCNIPKDLNSGTKDSEIQYLNCHLYDKYIKKFNLNHYLKYYDNMVLDIKYLINYYNYINQNKQLKILYIKENNTNNLKKLLKKYNINIQINKQIRAGYGLMTYIINKNIKPFIISFSINNNNCLYKKDRISVCHDIKKEGQILIQLHNKNIIDASLCLLQDSKEINLNCNYFYPTINSLKILKKQYDNIIKLNKNNFHNNFILKLKKNFKKFKLINNNLIII